MFGCEENCTKLLRREKKDLKVMCHFGVHVEALAQF